MKDRFKQVRESITINGKKVTQDEFANILGVKRNTITAYETGLRKPSGSVITILKDKYKINPDWLLTGEGDMYIKEERTSQIARFTTELYKEDPDLQRKRMPFIMAIQQLNEDQLNALYEFVKAIKNRPED